MARRIRHAIKQDKHFVQGCLQFPEPHGSIEPVGASRATRPTLHEVVHKFGTEEQCRAYLERIRWPQGPSCLRCKEPEVRKIQGKGGRTGKLYRCVQCRYQFSVITGTQLRRTHLLSEWLIAIYLMLSSPKSLPAKQLERLLGVNYRTAREMVRLLGKRSSNGWRLLETYISYNDPAEWKPVEEVQQAETQGAVGE
jgi:transposase-like protein